MARAWKASFTVERQPRGGLHGPHPGRGRVPVHRHCSQRQVRHEPMSTTVAAPEASAPVGRSAVSARLTFVGVLACLDAPGHRREGGQVEGNAEQRRDIAVQDRVQQPRRPVVIRRAGRDRVGGSAARSRCRERWRVHHGRSRPADRGQPRRQVRPPRPLGSLGLDDRGLDDRQPASPQRHAGRPRRHRTALDVVAAFSRADVTAR
jgi:hypothetical protein